MIRGWLSLSDDAAEDHWCACLHQIAETIAQFPGHGTYEDASERGQRITPSVSAYDEDIVRIKVAELI